jgi:hypothetical protein
MMWQSLYSTCSLVGNPHFDTPFFIIIYSNETNKHKILKFIQRSIQKKININRKTYIKVLKNVTENTIFQKKSFIIFTLFLF